MVALLARADFKYLLKFGRRQEEELSTSKKSCDCLDVALHTYIENVNFIGCSNSKVFKEKFEDCVQRLELIPLKGEEIDTFALPVAKELLRWLRSKAFEAKYNSSNFLVEFFVAEDSRDGALICSFLEDFKSKKHMRDSREGESSKPVFNTYDSNIEGSSSGKKAIHLYESGGSSNLSNTRDVEAPLLARVQSHSECMKRLPSYLIVDTKRQWHSLGSFLTEQTPNIYHSATELAGRPFEKFYQYLICSSAGRRSLLFQEVMTQCATTLLDMFPLKESTNSALHWWLKLYETWKEYFVFVPTVIESSGKIFGAFSKKPGYQYLLDDISRIIKMQLDFCFESLKISEKNLPWFLYARTHLLFATVNTIGTTYLLKGKHTRSIVISKADLIINFLNSIFNMVDLSTHANLLQKCIDFVFRLSGVLLRLKKKETSVLQDLWLATVALTKRKDLPSMILCYFLNGLQKHYGGLLAHSAHKFPFQLMFDSFENLSSSEKGSVAGALPVSCVLMIYAGIDRQNEKLMEEKVLCMLRCITHACEANAQLYSQMLPSVLCATFQPQQILSLTMEEFISCGAHNGIYISKIIFEVIRLLITDGINLENDQLVCSSIINSLNNWVLQNPRYAHICLTVLFLAVSNEKRSYFILSYVIKFFAFPELFPKQLFHALTMDFYKTKMLEAADRKLLVKTFKSANLSMYAEVAAICES
ncbi:uncharacterized protein LOC135121868 [Zophobas morio]|uniref:uncharacterized protein LOC135121868 n=1 Tax=Zophobas morio TaxID=2755281 RepID=UPI0030839D6D